ncbi:response regulator [Alcanivorax quisquiliarum]|uniref:Response regulator n=1 Tax=Alcanivorax quisquiliarum TaxID=2933565 RepID=A0ABT0E6W7_9GAMM|nr:response regulator [Alcanivorax quisquiliarum]
MQVLLVEDDTLIATGIVAGLKAHGITAHHATNAETAEAACVDNIFDAVVLDLGLPDRDGLTLLETLRVNEHTLPVLILTARDAVEHRLDGLRGGADDYMTKPFDLRELAARLHVLARRAQGRAVQVITAGPLRLEPESGQAFMDGEPVALSRREIELLTYLAGSSDRWLPADVLRDRLYGFGEEFTGNALNVHIHNIRRKLGSQSIQTARGLGYRLGWKVAP